MQLCVEEIIKFKICLKFRNVLSKIQNFWKIKWLLLKLIKVLNSLSILNCEWG